MKLIVTADDFAITDAVTDGILKAARDGALTQTGLFSNMEGAEYAVNRLLKEAPHICLGQDINLVCGKPVSDPKLIPSLVQEDGSFKTSGMHRVWDKTEPNHIPYEEAYIEVENQVKRYIELVGHAPEYISGHSYGTEETRKAMDDVAAKYGVIRSDAMYKKLGVGSGPETAAWNKVTETDANGKWKFDAETQLSRDPLQMFIDGKLEYLTKALKENGIAHIHTHTGYADRNLFRRSSFTLIRIMEQDFICSPELMNWIKENQVELVNFRNFK
jgi:predicted glycoside hydrolase/deacetylase ChbG (UPF0249 family)